MSADRLSFKFNPLDSPLPKGRPGGEDMAASLAESFTEPTCNSVSQLSSGSSTPRCFHFRLSSGSGTLQEDDLSMMTPEVDNLKTMVLKRELEIGQLLSHARAMEATIMDQKVQLQVQEHQMAHQLKELAAYRAQALPTALWSTSPPIEGSVASPCEKDLETREQDSCTLLEAWWRGSSGAIVGQHMQAIASSLIMGVEYVEARERQARQVEEAEYDTLAPRWLLQSAELTQRTRVVAEYEAFLTRIHAVTDPLLERHRQQVEAFELLEVEELVFRASIYALADSLVGRIANQERTTRQARSQGIAAFIMDRLCDRRPATRSVQQRFVQPAAQSPLDRLQWEEETARQALTTRHHSWAAAAALEARALAGRAQLEAQYGHLLAEARCQTQGWLAHYRRCSEQMELLEAEELVFRASIYALADGVVSGGWVGLCREELRGRSAILCSRWAVERCLGQCQKELQELQARQEEARWLEEVELLEAEELVFRAALWALAEAVLGGGRLGVQGQELAGRTALMQEWQRGLVMVNGEKQLVVAQLWREQWVLLASDEVVTRISMMTLWEQMAMLKWADFQRGLEAMANLPGPKAGICSGHYDDSEPFHRGKLWLQQIPDVLCIHGCQDSMAADFPSMMFERAVRPRLLCNLRHGGIGSIAESLRYRCLHCQQDWCRDCVAHLPEYALPDGTLAFLCDCCR
eukprot:GGOE01006847.1.p1 GENE.GGOE01006847.1~~GGOE01006847.1.p1  ORF type:complete len:711 (-),score=209.14 GGOE01006847.1:1197-3278(-)